MRFELAGGKYLKQMSLKKPITVKGGFSAEYFRIRKLIADFTLNNLTAVVELFANEEAKDESLAKNHDGEINQLVVEHHEYLIVFPPEKHDKDIRKYAYEEIKAGRYGIPGAKPHDLRNAEDV